MIPTLQEAIKLSLDGIIDDLNRSTQAIGWSASGVYVKLGAGALTMAAYTATAIDNVAHSIALLGDAVTLAATKEKT